MNQTISPVHLAENLARTGNRRESIQGTAIIFNGLTEQDLDDPLKMPWPKKPHVAEAAAKYIHVREDLISDPEFLDEVIVEAARLVEKGIR